MSARPGSALSGSFITFEGCDGSGKSTQVARLAAHLRDAGRDVVETREPGGSPRAEAIRALLLSGKASRFGAFAETMLFNAARADHLRTAIRPALERGAIVICDRFADSTRAYQGVLGEVSAELVLAAEDAVVGETRPELTIILDLPAELTLKRLAGRGGPGTPDKFEADALAHHARLRQAYLDIAAQAPERCVVVSARRSIDQVAERIARLVDARLDRNKPKPPARRSKALMRG
ncbi:thymidylate kinase [Rhizobiales bacterium GAS191]|jgi:dTMP kinase|nr:thymidylate kinase [Rhizobiales bacterium GAS191]